MHQPLQQRRRSIRAGVLAMLLAWLQGAIWDRLLPAQDAVPVAMTLPLRSALSDLIQSKDGAHLFVLDLTHSKVLKIETKTLQVVKEREVERDASCLCM